MRTTRWVNLTGSVKTIIQLFTQDQHRMSLSHTTVSFIKLENDMHTCIFLRGIERIDPHSDAVNRNNFASLYFI